jgi:hypothetical protein
MKNKTTVVISSFILGVLIGGIVIWITCFKCMHCCCPSTCEVPIDTSDISRIQQGTANSYFLNYLIHKPIHVDTLKALSISGAQFRAMKIIAKDTSVHGFRIYMGLDKKQTPVRMVVGTGSPDKTETIYITSDEGSGLCPFICDDKSDIMQR